MANLEGVSYCERVAMFDVKQVRRARKAIFHAFEIQIKHNGFGFVELLSACPTNLKMSPAKSQKWVSDEMMKTFPLGVFKDLPTEPAPGAASAPVAQGAAHAV